MRNITELKKEIERHQSRIEYHQEQIEKIKSRIGVAREMENRKINTAHYVKRHVLEKEKEVEDLLKNETYKTVSIGGKTFYITDKGDIYNSCRKYKGGKTKNGYILVQLNHEQKYAHRLVWEAFNGKIPEGMEIDHINTIRDDNRLCNLRLVTPKENKKNPITLERYKESNKGKISPEFRTLIEGRKKRVCQYTLDGELVKIWDSTYECEIEGGFRHSEISKCCNGKQKTHRNFVWKYENNGLKIC